MKKLVGIFMALALVIVSSFVVMANDSYDAQQFEGQEVAQQEQVEEPVEEPGVIVNNYYGFERFGTTLENLHGGECSVLSMVETQWNDGSGEALRVAQVESNDWTNGYWKLRLTLDTNEPQELPKNSIWFAFYDKDYQRLGTVIATKMSWGEIDNYLQYKANGGV